MSVETILRREAVRRIYGDPPWPTFYYRIKNGDIPRPDLMLGPQTPGWRESTIAGDLKEKADRGYVQSTSTRATAQQPSATAAKRRRASEHEGAEPPA